MLIYIVRHGLTEWNKLKKLQGAADVPLAKEGILLAEKTGEALKGKADGRVRSGRPECSDHTGQAYSGD